ncbi:hypothetical protein [Piscinibacter sp. HJYY11]|uniref:hypothetical protein n=1 Tax=Piscinibacter sp. HJYY11 TaxID=2801333 RepID=UPI00191E3188|nr:hypothetical protein [Piscinibacter sp. HJYY11]MBL0729667.1 hypothetical protein [Piscinibacter sp. HJYY11]
MATNYTAKQLCELAAELDAMAEALPVDAPGGEGKEYYKWCQALGGAASNLRLMAVQDIMADTSDPLSEIILATSEAKRTIARLKKFTRSVELIGDVLLLSTVIWLRKWSLVSPTFKELRADLKG